MNKTKLLLMINGINIVLHKSDDNPEIENDINFYLIKVLKNEFQLRRSSQGCPHVLTVTATLYELLNIIFCSVS